MVGLFRDRSLASILDVTCGVVIHVELCFRIRCKQSKRSTRCKPTKRIKRSTWIGQIGYTGGRRRNHANLDINNLVADHGKVANSRGRGAIVAYLRRVYRIGSQPNSGGSVYDETTTAGRRCCILAACNSASHELFSIEHTEAMTQLAIICHF
jgi:hypothetical protein